MATSTPWGLEFGGRNAGFAPTKADNQLLSGASPGLFLQSKFGEFSPTQYDTKYNPWGKGPDAQAMLDAFNQKLTENSSAALDQYAQLQIKAYGYQYEPFQARPAEGVSRAEREQYAQAQATPTDRGSREQAMQESQARYNGPAAFEMAKQQARAKTVETAIKTPTYSRVAPKALSATESYMLWRYNYRFAQTGQNIGAGPSDKYFFGNFQNKSKAEAQKNVTEFVKVGQQTNRKIRASGKTSFNTGAQV